MCFIAMSLIEAGNSKIRIICYLKKETELIEKIAWK